MNSHIQMPRFMLKRFENERHELFYYDVQTKVLAVGHSKSINTGKDYYSDEMEKYINQELETPFSKQLHFLDDIDFDAESFSIPQEFEKTVKLFLHSLLVRCPNMNEGIRRNSIYFELFDVQSQHNMAVLVGMEV